MTNPNKANKGETGMGGGYSINDLMFVFYWRNRSKDDWSISQPITLGEIIDDAELDFGDDDITGGSLPLHDIDWGNDEVRVVPVPSRSYLPTHGIKQKGNQ